MNWEKICILCQTELEQLEARLPPLTSFFHPHENVEETFLRCERETNAAVEFAIRQFAAANEWSSLNPIQEVMLSFRLDFGASIVCLLAQQPAPWTDVDQPNQKEHRLCWLMLFAWENEGSPKLQKTLHRLVQKN